RDRSSPRRAGSATKAWRSSFPRSPRPPHAPPSHYPAAGGAPPIAGRFARTAAVCKRRSIMRYGIAHGSCGGFLLDALVALLIFSFGVLAMVGLHARAVRHINEAQY